MIDFRLIIIELQLKKRTIFVWFFVWILMALIMALAFEAMKDSFSTPAMQDFLDQDIYKMFGFEANFFEKVEYFIGGEFFSFYSLSIAAFGLFLGINSLAGGIIDKTITSVMIKNISRESIFISKAITLALFSIITNTLIAVVTLLLFYVFTDQKEISVSFFVNAFFAFTILQILFTYVGMFFGVVVGKGKSLGIGMGAVGISWFLNSLSLLDGYPDYLKPISPFYYINVNMLTQEFLVDWPRMALLISFTAIFFVWGILAFKQKDVYI